MQKAMSVGVEVNFQDTLPPTACTKQEKPRVSRASVVSDPEYCGRVYFYSEPGLWPFITLTLGSDAAAPSASQDVEWDPEE